MKFSKSATHLDEHNIFITQLALRHPDKIIQAYWVNPLDPNCYAKMVKHYEIYQFKMLKLHQCWNKFDIDMPLFIDIVKFAKKNKLPMFIHLDFHQQVNRFIKIANTHQDVNFIVAHMIEFNNIYPYLTGTNVYFDISAPFLIPMSVLRRALETVGSDRLLFGSDTPYGSNNPTINFKRLSELDLTESQMSDILAKNIIKLGVY